MIKAIIRTLRPYQWTKNSLVFAALIFSLSFFQTSLLFRSVAAFFLFCAASSAVYIMNDLKDLNEDRLHPLKKNRPLPSGKLPIGVAVAVMILLAGIAITGSLALHRKFAVVLGLYFLLNIGYSFGLKKIVILDVMMVSAGFLLRALAGAAVIDVEASRWLFLCTLMLALMLTAGKRYHEISFLQAQAGNHRKSLGSYNQPLLEAMLIISGGASILTYGLYTISDETIAHIGSPNLIYSTLFVVFGVFRYLYLLYMKAEGGDPARLVISDIPFIVNGFLWLCSILFIIYYQNSILRELINNLR
ncbi:MAG TPA: decaprenyl-phosphate phosphoribosyltransferase [Bacteroidales bacterium]|nr:decaprenyl-phosphate phosphoribosyltransferase [Bacteroidales bacterium]